jgi:hypothetical protein
MTCRYTYKGKTYEAHEFDDLLRALPPAEAVQHVLGRGKSPAGWADTGNSRGTGVIPAAPFVNKTDAWVSLAIKRIIKLAVDEGYDRVAFVNGDQSAERYDLSKQIAALNYIQKPDGTFNVRALPTSRGAEWSRTIVPQGIDADKLSDYVGKEVAQKIINGEGEVQRDKTMTLSGLDLKVGGEGMKAFYDQIVPKVAKDVLRKLGGGSLTSIEMNTKGTVAVRRGVGGQVRQEAVGEPTKQPAFDITDSMREKAAGGLPMFSLREEERRKSPWLDSTNRVQFLPGKWLYRSIGQAATPLLTKIGMKAASPELQHELRQMKLVVQKAQETAAAVAHEAMKLSDEERQMVSDIIEQELDAGVTPPSHAVRLAAVMNQAMGTQTQELVRLGMLSEDAATRWDGKYLPRFYESKLRKQVGDAWADAVRRVTGRTSTMTGIKGKHLKGRGMWESIAAADLPSYEALGWEVRDPEYKPGDDEVQVWRDYTREERDKMGEIRDAGFRFVMGYMQTQKDIALGRMFAGMAADPKMSSRLQKDGWVQVPKTVVEGTGVKRYGKLAGRFVPQDVMSHLSQIEEASSEAWQMYRKAMSIWKEGKTVLNPVSHVNNIVGNLTMAHLAGVSYHRADKYIAAIKDFTWKVPMLTEAKDAGLFLGSMSHEELLNTLPEELKQLVAKGDSATMKGTKFVYNAMTFFLRKPMGAAYAAEDTFFRYLIYRDARTRGASPTESVDFANEFIFTYDNLPKGARLVRDFGIPFFAYTYKAIPALLHTSLVYPWRMAAPAALLWTANAAAYAIATGDDGDDWYERLRKYLNDPAHRKRAQEQEELERENLPPWMRGRTAMFMTQKTLRLGSDELTKLPLFIDVSRFIPGGDLFDVSPNAGGVPFPQPFTPSHPLFTIATGMLANKDLFTGKELVDSNDTNMEAATKRADWLWKQVSPAIAAGNAHWERGMNALAQASGGEIKWLPDPIAEKYTGIGRDGLPVQPHLAAAQTFGIKIRPIDLETSEKIQEGEKNKLLYGIEAEMRSLRRLNNLGALSDKTFDRANDLAIEKKDRLHDGLTVDGVAQK